MGVEYSQKEATCGKFQNVGLVTHKPLPRRKMSLIWLHLRILITPQYAYVHCGSRGGVLLNPIFEFGYCKRQQTATIRSVVVDLVVECSIGL